MSRKKITHEEVARWIAVNGRRWKRVRLLTDNDIARRCGVLQLENDRTLNFNRDVVTKIFGDKWKGPSVTCWLLNALNILVALANALGITPAELLSRPDDMTVEDGRVTSPKIKRMKQRRALTQEQQVRQALLESLGLDSDDRDF